jgi:threonine aldolase
MNQYKNTNTHYESLKSGDSIDFRSDTLTIPSAAMLESIQGAKLGDDVYGEDLEVIELQ